MTEAKALAQKLATATDATEDKKEGISAFLEKRQAKFTGK